MDPVQLNELLNRLTKQPDEYVDCANLKMSDVQLSVVLAALETTSVTAKSLNFQGNQITSAGVKVMVEFVARFSVSEINLSNNLIDEVGCASLLLLFDQKGHLSMCDLEGNPCPEHFIIRLKYLAQSALFTDSLYEALFRNKAEKVIFTGTKYLNLDSRLLKFVFQDMEGLKEVDFSGIGAGDGWASEIGRILKESKIETFAVRNCSISDSGLAEFVRSADLANHPYLKYIDFSENRSISNDGVRNIYINVFNTNSAILSWNFAQTGVKRQLLKAIEEECQLNMQPKALKNAVVALRSRSPEAAEINLQWEKDIDKCMRFLGNYIRDSKDLRVLNLGNTGINDEDLKLLATALSENSSLRVLGIANNKITVSGIEALFSVLKCPNTLEEVNLANNDLGDDSAALIVDALRLNPNLKFINVDVNPGISDERMNEIGNLVLINRTQPILRNVLVKLEMNAPDMQEADFSMKEVTLNDKDVFLLCRTIRSNTVLKKLNLSKNIIGDSGISHLAHALSENKSIVEIDLSANSIANQGANYICEALRTNASLKVLNLSDNAFGAQGVEGFLTMLRSNHTLRKVSMDNTRVSKEIADAIKHACDLNQECPEVKMVYYKLHDGDINMSKIDFAPAQRQWSLNDASLAVLYPGLRGNSSVKIIDLSNNEIGAEGCKYLKDILLHPNCNIICLNLFNNPIGDDGVAALMEALPSNHSLTFLDLSKTNLTNVAAEAVATALKKNDSLQTLLVDDNFSGDSLKEVERQLAINREPRALKAILLRCESEKSIENVDLSQESLGDMACALFCTTFLHSVFLRSVNLSSNAITTASVTHLVELIKTCPNLVSLDLSNNRIDDSGAIAIIACLETFSHVRAVNLQNNSVSAETLARVAYVLRLSAGSEKLKQILLKHQRGEKLDEVINLNGGSNRHRLTDNDIMALVEVLRDTTSIRALDLGNNDVTNVGCVALADVLRHNHSMEALYLDHNSIGAETGEALFYALKINPQLHTLILDNTDVPEELLEDIESLLHVNQTPLKKRIDFRGLGVENIDDKIQFHSTDYYLSQEEKIEKDVKFISQANKYLLE